MSRAVNKLAVIGAGQMGGGIAQTAAVVAKLPVIIYDSNDNQLAKQRSFIESLLRKDVSKQKLSEADLQDALDRISTTSKMADLAEADFVIEAITENYDAKKSVFLELGKIIRNEEAIVASNTSSISITRLAASYRRPDHFVGMHFMNPGIYMGKIMDIDQVYPIVPMMKLVELIAGRQTSETTLQTTRLFAETMGKTTTLSQDIPGFIANRILMPYINEAIFTLYEGVGSREDIDRTMVLGTNVPMGPLKLADFIGLDTCLAIQRILHQELGDDKYRPCPLLVQYVNAGWLGKKTGRGFYEYPATK